MTFDQLEAFEMIVEKGSFKAAASALHKTQPTLSISIKKLEEEFELQLFDRDSYRPTLTDEGKVFFTWAQQCLRSFRELTTIGKELGPNRIEPQLLIVLDPLTRFAAVDSIFEECLAKSVPTQLTLRSEILGAGLELLLNGRADFAIAPMLKQQKNIESSPFEAVELVPCITPDLWRDSEYHGKSRLRELTQIVVRSPEALNQDDSLGVISEGKKCFVTDHALKRSLIQHGFGWGRLARHEVEEDLAKGRLQIMELDGVETIRIELHLMRNRQKPMGPVAKAIWQRLLSRSAGNRV